jgi:filamentous hemagglutinin family protein
MKSKLLLTIILLTISLEINAEITTDGSLGSRANLPGPDYLIGADLGRHKGGNLFHSFKDFNLNSLESATFSGSNSINNIVSRVTGGNPSNIDGLIRSTIPNAALYFLNPYGIMFGPNAQLDVQGSFHASTADYLRFGDGGRFDARNLSDSLLTVAPVEAFGFLSNSPTEIKVQSSELATTSNADLSLIGGNLTINNARLSSKGGRLNLVSVIQAGEVISKDDRMDMRVSDTSTFRQQGRIDMTDSHVNMTGSSTGGVTIRGGQFFMHDSEIDASSVTDQNGKNIDILVTDSVNISGDSTEISTHSFGKGNSGNIAITAPYLEIVGSVIDASSFGAGRAGNIDIEATKIMLKNGAYITSSIVGSGQGGHINVKSLELTFSGRRSGTIVELGLTFKDFPSTIGTTTFGTGLAGKIAIETDRLNMNDGIISADTFGTGDASSINIRAGVVNITGGAIVSSTTLAQGQGGDVNVEITDTLSISGKRSGLIFLPNNIILQDNQSIITSSTLSNAKAGRISISAPTITLDNGASISASTSGSGTAGNIEIDTKDLRITNGAQLGSTSGFQIGEDIFIGTGQGGNILVQTDKLTLQEGGNITAVSLGTGNAGNIDINVANHLMSEKSAITSQTLQADGGNINIHTNGYLYLVDGDISTSVSAQKGNGGNISLTPEFVVLDNSKIIARAVGGDGGNIDIKTTGIYKFSKSPIDASSKLGIDGTIKVDSPDIDMEGFLVVLPGGFVEESLIRCDTKEIENPNTFKVTPRRKSPPFFR